MKDTEKQASTMTDQEKRQEIAALAQQLGGRDLASLLLIARAYVKRSQ